MLSADNLPGGTTKPAGSAAWTEALAPQAPKPNPKLDTPALRRDALGKILPKLKKAAIGYTTMDVGVERIKSAQAGSETRRRQARVARLQELLTEEGLRDLAPEEPEEPEEPETPEIPEEPEVESPPDALLPQ